MLPERPKTKLKYKYIVGCHVMWYEMKMLSEYVQSIIFSVEDIENPENIVVELCFNMQEYLEKYDNTIGDNVEDGLLPIVWSEVYRLESSGVGVVMYCKRNYDDFYNIADYRRDLNTRGVDYDIVMWGETDSLWPREAFKCIEYVHESMNALEHPKYIMTFGYRKNWDASWDILTHPLYAKAPYEDNDKWVLHNQASEKSYMRIDEMNEINAKYYQEQHETLKTSNEPKFDGSCLVIASELIRSGVNIPYNVFHCGEDTAFGLMAKRVMGDKYIQVMMTNVLRVHNRRHPKKRSYILNEDNPRGFCGKLKGDWWNALENASKDNLSKIFTQEAAKYRKNDFIETIKISE